MASAGAPPSAPDPNTVINAQEMANHYNASNPFGSASWSKGPDGRDTMTQSMSPVMQQLMNQATSSAMTPRQQMTDPFGGGMSQLASAIMGRVGARYGLGTGNANNPTIPGEQNFPHGGGPGQFSSTAQAKGNQAPPPPGGSGAASTGMGMPSLQGMQGGAPSQPGMGGPSGMPGLAGIGGLGAQNMQVLQGMQSPMGMPTGMSFNPTGPGQQQTQPMPGQNQQII